MFDTVQVSADLINNWTLFEFHIDICWTTLAKANTQCFCTSLFSDFIFSAVAMLCKPPSEWTIHLEARFDKKNAPAPSSFYCHTLIIAIAADKNQFSLRRWKV